MRYFWGRSISYIDPTGKQTCGKPTIDNEMMAVDPLRRVVAPRFWAGLFSMPALAMIFSAVGILGGHLVGVDWLGVDSGSY